jgi:DNA replicative helicase MCM subunit Mcm2 (Cdc46/Mcm family)
VVRSSSNPHHGVVGSAPACSEARILGSQDTKVIPLRKVGARHIGSLVRIRGMVTRTTEVKPLMIVAAYTCSDCETAIYQVLPYSSPTTLI